MHLRERLNEQRDQILRNHGPFIVTTVMLVKWLVIAFLLSWVAAAAFMCVEVPYDWLVSGTTPFVDEGLGPVASVIAAVTVLGLMMAFGIWVLLDWIKRANKTVEYLRGPLNGVPRRAADAAGAVPPSERNERR